MKSKFKSVNEQKQKDDKEKLEWHLQSLHRRNFIGDDVLDCPVCNCKNTLAVVMNEKTATAKCSYCNVGTQVKECDSKCT